MDEIAILANLGMAIPPTKAAAPRIPQNRKSAACQRSGPAWLFRLDIDCVTAPSDAFRAAMT
jgi:hypothetical protein